MTEPTAPQPPSRSGPDGSWVPVFWSIVVYPGIGQWMQRRRNASSFYLGVFTLLAALFAWVLYTYLSQLLPILTDALAGNGVEGREIPPLNVILKPFAAVLFVYAANVVDVLRGRSQVRRKAKAASTSVSA